MADNHALIPNPVKMYTQTDALKDAKDMSKNLVSGDFEKHYRDDIMIEKPRRRHMHLFLGVSVGVLAIWMIVLTVVREVQITRLRLEVDELNANMIAVTANVKSLNQKLANNRLFNEMNDDTFYADDDEVPTAIDEKSNDKSKGSIKNLGDLTVLEDEESMADDDEDSYDDDDDAESGDWYQDYDRRRPKVGTTNMVKLKPEDFTDAVLTFSKGKKDYSTNIRELKWLLDKEDMMTFKVSQPTKEPNHEDSSRSKRSIVPAVAVESFEPKQTPKTLSKSDERRKTKKFSPNTETFSPAKVALHGVTRTIRSDEEGYRRPFIAAHFHGNTSHLNTEIHPHYKGNGLVRMPHNVPHNVWYPSPWTKASPHPRPTLTSNGHVHVHHTGVYLVYVQIYYLDSHDVISWVLHRTNSEIEGRETLLQCAQSSHSIDPMDKPNSCFSAAALFLKAGDKLAVRNTGGDRHSIMQPEKSFIGLVKLADAEDPNESMEL
ncbi:uncharacterized protein LOC113230091 [Hyposmocoma kahamanoa]|uniref:uncharacterized protein LOC113230091 n=1 Tax=Hyposmocoma kahamanoa TaxID=1477025 RepID=UPI000E6D7F59|nr:uncharacterized protein LOC113230091 [Hyposmocoma kahamanoa]